MLKFVKSGSQEPCSVWDACFAGNRAQPPLDSIKRWPLCFTVISRNPGVLKASYSSFKWTKEFKGRKNKRNGEMPSSFALFPDFKDP